MERKNSQRWYLVGLSIVLLGLMTIAFWQNSLSFGDFRPNDPQQTLILWGISILLFLGMIALGFVWFRYILRLYVERQGNQLGSKIKTRLVAGALGLTILPVVFLYLFSFTVLNRTMDKWFTQPIDRLRNDSLAISEQLKDAARDKSETMAGWVASLPEVAGALERSRNPAEMEKRIREFALAHWLCYVAVGADGSDQPLAEYSASPQYQEMWGKLAQLRPSPATGGNSTFSNLTRGVAFASSPIGGNRGWVLVGQEISSDLSARQQAIEAQYRDYLDQGRAYRMMKYTYMSVLSLITLFILFVATWAAMFLSKQIVLPIERLVQATAQVSRGDLDYRVETSAIDELGLLVRSFNQMTEQLEHSREELDARRRFTEAILEAIPTGVISLSARGEILRVNPALGRVFPAERAATARWLEDLFSGEDAAKVKRLIRRARRTGLATGSLDLTSEGQVKHLAVTVSALESGGSPAEGALRGCVLVLEDTSELLRAQKSAAWQEVAQRVAHEIKNPLTPIALSAERISRLVERHGANPDVRSRLDLDRLLQSCTATITREIETLKALVDEFSQFARFPSARPEPGDLNDIVESALETCNGKLDSLRIEKQLAPGLPLVSVDPEQFRRAVVNLLDNAIEAMSGKDEESSGKVLTVATTLGAGADTVEMVVADSGHGIAPEDREKLFLPYFSTRKRGTGLGLAIVSRIVAEHKGVIRVENNQPRGAKFIVEIPTVETRMPADAMA